MKRLNLTILFILFISNLSVFSQIKAIPEKEKPIFTQTFCKTLPNMPSANFSLMQTSSSFFDFSNASACVRIYVHVIRRTDGSGGQSTSNVIQALNILDMDYNPIDIFFKWDGIINYINNTSLYNNPNQTVFNINNHTDGVDIYLFSDEGPAGGLANGVGGSSEFFVGGNYWNPPYNPLVRSHVISHEMGHVLGLYHTHHGTYNEGGNDNPCPELVNGTNSHICGDYVTDTPADPHIHFLVDSFCNWTGSGSDANGQPYNPDELNIMSYSSPSCMDYFTSKQKERMITAMIRLPFLQSVSNYTLNPLQSGHTICDALSILDFSLSPNPVKTTTDINIDNFNTQNIYHVKIYDVFYNLVYINILNSKKSKLDISYLKNGIYYIKIDNETSSKVKPIIVNN